MPQRPYFDIVNVVKGCESRSRKAGFSQANSGWAFRCFAALKSMPQEWPIDALNDIAAAIVASATLFCTAPAVPYSGCQGFDPRGESSTWPQRVRSLGSTFFENVS